LGSGVQKVARKWWKIAYGEICICVQLKELGFIANYMQESNT